MPTSQTLPSPLRAPSLALLLAEPLRAMLDAFGSHVTAHPESVGDGHPVIVYPGLGAGSMNTSQLRNFLRHAGFQANDWGGGVNIGHEGEFDEWLDGLAANVREVQDRHDGRKVSLIGWSLGGIFAREIAKREPDAVRTVITLATPFSALGDSTHAGALYKMLNGDAGQLAPAVEARLRESPPVPTTSIFSKSDGIVNWRGCIEKRSRRTESVEVDASHLGMVNHPDVLRIVANRLAQPEGRWKPLKRAERLRPSAWL
ncbi:esterase/lipase family protein [Caenimonas terrae]|uniref:Esterase/lipase family protein n=1 Tax=Caenimonas terrae TaxID=696074 RepID=A0ABW0NGB3_9BURK